MFASLSSARLLLAVAVLGLPALSQEAKSAADKAKPVADKAKAVADAPRAAAVSTLEAEDLVEFAALSPELQKVVRAALALTKRGLTYTFASHDPARGGMDCSGTIYHLLTSSGVSATPRQSDQMAEWVRDKGQLHLLAGAVAFTDAPFQHMQAGDLVFWSGTYESTARKLPITHVMLYLGTRKKDGKRVLFGASDGRSYEGQRRCGVSVFDFAIPKAGGKAALHSYGRIPLK
jgi:cell wall-associated NlpC family hydrolase